MGDIYKNIEESNQNKKPNILILFDALIADMLSNKKLNPVVTEFFIGGKYFLHNLILLYQKTLG